MEPHDGQGRLIWTTSSPNTGPKWVYRRLIDLSTISNRSTSPHLKNPHLIEASTICEVQPGNATFFVYLPTAPCTIAPLAASLDQEYQYTWEPQTLL